MLNVQIDLRVNNTVVRDQFLWVRARFLTIFHADPFDLLACCNVLFGQLCGFT
jgi:hypothetical protein